MDNFLGMEGWALDLLLRIQSGHSGFLDTFFQAITQLGYEPAFLVILPFVYWCLNRAWGLRLFYWVMLSTGFNALLKNWLKLPRPDPAVVRRLDPIEGFGLPSNHAQTGGVVLWLYMAAQVKRGWFTAAAAILAFLIGFSRLYLGAHFPMDVFVGWALGLLTVWAALRFEPWWQRRWAELSLKAQVALAVAGPLLLLLLIPADHHHLYPAKDAGTLAGILIGMSLGAILERRTVRFQVDGPAARRLLRYLAGMVVVVIVYVAGSLIPDLSPWLLDIAVRVLRYAATGLAGVWLAPWLFVRIGLAGRED